MYNVRAHALRSNRTEKAKTTTISLITITTTTTTTTTATTVVTLPRPHCTIITFNVINKEGISKMLRSGVWQGRMQVTLLKQMLRTTKARREGKGEGKAPKCNTQSAQQTCYIFGPSRPLWFRFLAALTLGSRPRPNTPHYKTKT